MAINKVTYMGETLIDLTQDTITPDMLGEGVTAHAANGETITGTAVIGGGSGSIDPSTVTVARGEDDLIYASINGELVGTGVSIEDLTNGGNEDEPGDNDDETKTFTIMFKEKTGAPEYYDSFEWSPLVITVPADATWEDITRRGKYDISEQLHCVRQYSIDDSDMTEFLTTIRSGEYYGQIEAQAYNDPDNFVPYYLYTTSEWNNEDISIMYDPDDLIPNDITVWEAEDLMVKFVEPSSETKTIYFDVTDSAFSRPEYEDEMENWYYIYELLGETIPYTVPADATWEDICTGGRYDITNPGSTTVGDIEYLEIMDYEDRKCLKIKYCALETYEPVEYENIEDVETRQRIDPTTDPMNDGTTYRIYN